MFANLVNWSLAPLLAPLQNSAPEWSHFELENGVKVSVMYVEDAIKESVFGVLRFGLLDDDAHKAQFAHLLEHVLIRTVDPTGMQVDEMLINGETTALGLRLECIAEATEWKAALERVSRWLSVREVSEDVLQREKEVIASEISSTASRGATHKWASAAWAQVAVHGLPHARVMGDVATATAKEAQDYLALKLADLKSLRLVMVGPVSAADAKPHLEKCFAGLKWGASAPLASPRDRSSDPQDLVATWDLAASHYLEWYPLPANTKEDVAAGQALSILLHMHLERQFPLKRLTKASMVTNDLISPYGRELLISANLLPDADVKALQQEIGVALQSFEQLVGTDPSVPGTLKSVVEELKSGPNLQLMRHSEGPNSKGLAEPTVAIAVIQQELMFGARLSEMASAFESLTQTRLAEVAKESLKSSKRRSLLLNPLADRPQKR